MNFVLSRRCSPLTIHVKKHGAYYGAGSSRREGIVGWVAVRTVFVVDRPDVSHPSINEFSDQLEVQSCCHSIHSIEVIRI